MLLVMTQFGVKEKVFEVSCQINLNYEYNEKLGFYLLFEE